MNDAEIIAHAIEVDVLDEPDAIRYAAALVRTGMDKSEGSLQRFVTAIADEHGDALARAIADGPEPRDN